MEDELLVDLGNSYTPSIIKVIGVGGGGGNAVGKMYLDAIPDVRYLVCNTDSKALDDSPVPDRLLLGPGLGVGGNPEKGRDFAEKYVEKIQSVLDEKTKMVFITAGMGGGTGTGVSPVVAREARKKGILTVGVVTIPFLFEKTRQIDKALDGLEALSKEVDALLVINNQRLLDIYPSETVIEAFDHADAALSTAVSSIIQIISMHGRWNLDFADVEKVLSKGGVAVMSTGYGQGENRLQQAIDNALHSPLVNNNDIFRATRMVMAITSNDQDVPLRMEELLEVHDFMSHFDDDIEAKYGMDYDSSLGDKVKVVILASGFNLFQETETESGKISFRQNVESKSREEEDKLAVRRGKFYSEEGKQQRHSSSKVYIFSADDLTNECVAEAVASTPTGTRSYNQWLSIRQMAGHE